PQAIRNHSPLRTALYSRRLYLSVGSPRHSEQPVASTSECPIWDRLARTTVINSRSERMGQLNSIDLPEPSARGAGAAPIAAPSKTRWWLWVLILGLIALGVWYYRSSKSASQAADSAAPAAAGKGGGRGGAGGAGFVVPVVVATAQRGDLPVYFNGLGTVTAFNTVTVRSRVDGQ